MDPPSPPPTADQPGSRKHPRPSPTRTLLTHPTGHDIQGTSPTETDAPASSPTFGGHDPLSPSDAQRRRTTGAERSSPSVSSSQGDMADNEQEAGPSQSSQQSQTTEPPAKKKRTRTLTTPHQSAVLHALLAQSRFPTTAMREEVGRAIGLSARKVQIWFQNQRQKARRPRGQSTAPLTRPPQYGPFSNIPPGTSEGSASTSFAHSASTSRTHMGFPFMGEIAAGLPGAGSGSELERLSHPSFLAERYPRSSSLSLSGPGIPGPSAGPREHYPLPREAPGSSTGHQSFSGTPEAYPAFDPSHRPAPGPSSLRGPFDVPQLGPPPARPRRAYQSADVGAAPGGPVMLPPIVADPRDSGRYVPGAEGARYPALAPISSIMGAAAGPSGQLHAAQRPEHAFAHQPAATIPPPFTLQPSPMWDDPAFSPYSRPSTSSRPGTSYATAPPAGPFMGAVALPPTPTSPNTRPQSPRPSSAYSQYDTRRPSREEYPRTSTTPRRSPR